MQMQVVSIYKMVKFLILPVPLYKKNGQKILDITLLWNHNINLHTQMLHLDLSVFH